MNYRIISNVAGVYMIIAAIYNLYLYYSNLIMYNRYDIFLSISILLAITYILILINKPYFERDNES